MRLYYIANFIFFIYMFPQFIFFDLNKNFIDKYKIILNNEIPNSYFIHDNLESLLQKHKFINTIISPANSYGFMNGGIDTVINTILDNVEPLVKQKIIQFGSIDNSGRNYLPVGKCFIVEKNNYYLFVAPTMTLPSKLPKDTLNISLAFYSILEEAVKLSFQTKTQLVIACPCLGTGVGQMNPIDSAKQILGAYKYFCKNKYFQK